MGLFSKKQIIDINQGVHDFNNEKGAVLVDVRTQEEYREGHIPNSKNVPLHLIDDIVHVAKQKETPLYIYCKSGKRSSQAERELKKLGYFNVKNLGGIHSYGGRVASLT